MSQHTVYKCDFDRKEIGAKPHITLCVRADHPGTGIAVPPSDSHSLWKTQRLNHSFLHFCNGKCIGSYFDALIKKATPAKAAAKKK